MATKKYFTLVQFNAIAKTWQPQFGDYDKQVVVDERDDMLCGYNCGVSLRKKDFKIIATTPEQKDIDAAVAALNAKL